MIEDASASDSYDAQRGVDTAAWAWATNRLTIRLYENVYERVRENSSVLQRRDTQTAAQ